MRGPKNAPRSDPGESRVPARPNSANFLDYETPIGASEMLLSAGLHSATWALYGAPMRLHKLAFVTLVSCTPTPSRTLNPMVPDGRSVVVPVLSSRPPPLPASIDDGPDPEGKVGKLVERGWRRWRRGSRVEALSDFSEAIEKEKSHYATLKDLVGAGAPSGKIISGTELGALGTQEGILVFRVASGEPVAWRSLYGSRTNETFAVRENKDLVLSSSDLENIEVFDLQTLQTRATYHTGSTWSRAALSADHNLLAYYTHQYEPEEGNFRLVDLKTGKNQWVAQPPGDSDDAPQAATIYFAPDNHSLVVLTAFISVRGPHYDKLAVLRVSDGVLLFSQSIQWDNSQDGRIGPAQPEPPLQFVNGGAELDFLNPKNRQTMRVDTRTGKAKLSPVKLSDKTLTTPEVGVPRELQERICHVGNYALPVEACGAMQ
jgi:hypothetical protein